MAFRGMLLLQVMILWLLDYLILEEMSLKPGPLQ